MVPLCASATKDVAKRANDKTDRIIEINMNQTDRKHCRIHKPGLMKYSAIPYNLGSC